MEPAPDPEVQAEQDDEQADDAENHDPAPDDNVEDEDRESSYDPDGM